MGKLVLNLKGTCVHELMTTAFCHVEIISMVIVLITLSDTPQTVKEKDGGFSIYTTMKSKSNELW